MLLLLFLALLSVAATIAIVENAELDGRGEVVAAATVVWNALVTLPVLVLGNLEYLDKKTLAARPIGPSSSRVSSLLAPVWAETASL